MESIKTIQEDDLDDDDIDHDDHNNQWILNQ